MSIRVQTMSGEIKYVGDVGPQGPQGPKGDIGPQGVQGIQGIKGEQGIQGEKGQKGDTGLTGPVGPANVLTIGTVIKGENPEATITGESPSQILNLILPKGDKGDKGEQGIPGASYDDTEVRNLINTSLQEAKDYTDNEIATFDFIKIVTALPSTGLPNRFYLVPKTNTTTNDFFDEYVWANNTWEFIGTIQVEIDLTNYALKSDVPKTALDIRAVPMLTGAQSMVSPIVDTFSGETIYEIIYNDTEFTVEGDFFNKLTIKSVPWNKITGVPDINLIREGSLIPAMSANEYGGYVAFASSEKGSTSRAYKAFDKTSGSWSSENDYGDKSGFVGIILPIPVSIKQVEVTIAYNGISSVILQGSNDNTNYTDIQTITNIGTTSGATDVLNCGVYKYYRLYGTGKCVGFDITKWSY